MKKHIENRIWILKGKLHKLEFIYDGDTFNTEYIRNRIIIIRQKIARLKGDYRKDWLIYAKFNKSVYMPAAHDDLIDSMKYLFQPELKISFDSIYNLASGEPTNNKGDL